MLRLQIHSSSLHSSRYLTRPSLVLSQSHYPLQSRRVRKKEQDSQRRPTSRWMALDAIRPWQS